MGLKDYIDSTFRRSGERRLTVEEYHAKLIKRGLNLDGSPQLDPTPIAPPIGYVKAPSMMQMMHDMLTNHKLQQQLEARGAETLEDFEDFDVEDEPSQLRSPHEVPLEDPTLSQLLAAGADAKRVREEAEKQKAPPAKPGEAPKPAAERPEEPPAPPGPAPE